MSGGIYSLEQIAESARKALAEHGDNAVLRNPFTFGSAAFDEWARALDKARAGQLVEVA